MLSPRGVETNASTLRGKFRTAAAFGDFLRVEAAQLDFPGHEAAALAPWMINIQMVHFATPMSPQGCQTTLARLFRNEFPANRLRQQPQIFFLMARRVPLGGTTLSRRD